MNIGIQDITSRAPSAARTRAMKGVPRRAGFTLIEVLVSVVLISTLVISAMAGIFTMLKMSGRTADYTGATAMVEAKIQDIRAATYNPPNYPWGTNTIYITNVNAVSLNQSGVSFMVPGTVISKIEPAGTSGHLAVVTGTFTSSSQSFSITMQTIVNKFSGGQQ